MPIPKHHHPSLQRGEKCRIECKKLYASYAFEVIFVNDGSSDKTYAIIADLAQKKPQIKLLDLSRNFGNQIAVSAGINEARGAAVITMDGDLQHPPAVIPKLIEQWEQGHEVVQAKRLAYRGNSSRFCWG